MRMFITSKNKYLSNDMKIFGTCSIPLIHVIKLFIDLLGGKYIIFVSSSFHKKGLKRDP